MLLTKKYISKTKLRPAYKMINKKNPTFFYSFQQKYSLGMIIGETAKHDMQENNDEFLRFGDVVIVKAFFHISKEMVNIMAADIKKIIVSNAFVFGINKKIDAV